MSEEFERPIDKIIREARERGDFDDLPGKGKPLQWEDETMVPEEQRMANRLLKNNNFAPDWVELGQEIDRDYATLRRNLDRARANHTAGWLDKDGYAAARETFTHKVRELNKRILGYNLRVPHERFQRKPYPVDPDA